MIFDLRDRLGLRLSDVEGLPASEAYALMFGIMRDSRTHFYGEIADQTFPGSHADQAVVQLAQGILNMGRKEQEQVKLLGPYYGYAERKKRQSVHVEPAVKQKLTERLKQYSSIPD